MHGSSVHVDDDTLEVAIVRWPGDAATRTLLASEGRPRLLVVDPGADAPSAVDALEDWVRAPVDPAELLARSVALRRRAAARTGVPRLDDDGLLHHDGRWVAIPDAQLAMVRLLLERYGQLVRTDELVAVYTAAGGSTKTSSVRTAVARLRVRLREVGLTLEVARRRGVVLQAEE